MNKRLALVALLCSLIATGCGTPNKPAPDATFKLIDGQRIELSELVGQTVLLNFWASTCHICMEEIPDLNRLYHDYKDKNFSLISVAMFYDPPNRVVETQKNKNIEFPISLDIDSKIFNAFGNLQGTPTYILIDASGSIIEQKLGRWDSNNLRQKIDSVLTKI